MISSADIRLFEKYRDAGPWAFGSKTKPAVVGNEDKQHYWRIYRELIDACEEALSEIAGGERLYVEPQRYSEDRGSRGHRPKDLWCAVRNRQSEDFNKMPQIYVIASKRGLELGFAVSISEAEYSDAKIKQQNRIIIPQIHRKLPISGTVIERLDAVVGNSPEWHVNASTRLLQDDDGFDAFQLPSDLFKSLKKEPLSRGGGAICRIFPASVFHEGKEVDLKLAFKEALEHFAEIQLSCAPSAPDRKFVIEQTKVAEFSEDEELWADQGDDADQINSDDVDTDQKFREVAVRQGQAKFRSNLIGLFDGKCAITGCAVAVALQAAHIVPYRKKSKLDLGNGLLLRADIHTLFDMFLLSVSPDDLTVHVSPQLEGTEYVALHGKKISLSHANRKGPSRAALRWHFEQLVSA